MRDKYHLCPLLGREIHEGYCYEITNAAYGMMKMSGLQDPLDRDTTARRCDACPNNQIADPKRTR